MMLTTRCRGSMAAFLCALLLQNCQSHSVSVIEDTDEKERPAAGTSSASAMRPSTSSEPLAMRPLTLPSASPAAHVSPFLSSKTSAQQDRSATFSSCSLSPSAPSTLATVSDSPKGPYDLPAAASPGASHAVPLGNTSGHASSPGSSRACASKVEEVLREMPSDEEEDPKPPAKRRSTNLNDELDGRNKQVCAEEGREYRCVCRDVLTILLGVASSQPDEAIQFLEVLLVASQDSGCRQQALEALGKVTQASPNMFSACLPSLRTAAKVRDKDVRLLALKILGEVEWKHYFGEVEPAPDLPSNMGAILDSTCPFWPGKTVEDTHLLVLIPTEVNGQPLSLNLLRDLIRHPNNGGHKTQYSYYGDDVRQQLGASSPAASYWLLMTRDVLPESRGKTYVNQRQLITDHAIRTGLPYELPKALEAVTAILTHYVRDEERLYSDSPSTYTRCQECILHPSNGCSVVVGSFEPSGLVVYRCFYSYGDYDLGVAGCRKF
jgi:hypothetical protein